MDHQEVIHAVMIRSSVKLIKTISLNYGGVQKWVAQDEVK